MSKYSLLSVAVQGEQMRNAQKLYFEQISKAKKSKNPEDFAQAKKTLAMSKNLERVFDDTILEISRGEYSLCSTLSSVSLAVEIKDALSKLSFHEEAIIKPLTNIRHNNGRQYQAILEVTSLKRAFFSKRIYADHVFTSQNLLIEDF
ncbi:hypothetical protein BDE36_1792 [Arcticibacter tournemirensis]|uniref:Uncharacterized protein n=1 Tax=Arcticibacter tournemirensis TaxID=699437 RepID=A0A5M9HEI0_9SPHI|nr:hypothetical protein [Arcticibacter tournemirensis]KAA8483744.1 hypothetical protein F1649_07600 [Arcticibacter tournemirensis]TQM50057.1 hypothetical protein BDE36_1792 [Arcticibacter tournemirensis]